MEKTKMKDDKYYIHMFEKDYERIRSWVLQFPNLETGGTLFGLWKNKHNLVAHFVLGPGKCCKRTNVSFFQDISYLESVGNSLTHDYMICHIGEWHSHHKLHLYKPSDGDVRTVVRNYPHGATSFVLIIANIVSSDKVILSPYVFTDETCARSYGARYDTGVIVYIPSESPFSNLEALKWKVTEGEEKYFYAHSDDGANERFRQATAGAMKYEPNLYGKNTKQKSIDKREARQGIDSESNRRNDLKNKEENTPFVLQKERDFVGETDKTRKTNVNSPPSVELPDIQSASFDNHGGSNSTATTTTRQITNISASGISSIPSSVIGNYGHECFGLGNKTYQNSGVVTTQPRIQDTIHQVHTSYQLLERSQPLTTSVSNAAYGGATITTSSAAKQFTYPSSATNETVLQQAGLDPPRVSNHGHNTTSPLTGFNNYSNEVLRTQVSHGRLTQVPTGSDPLSNTSGQNIPNTYTSVTNYSSSSWTSLPHVVHSSPSRHTCGSDPLRITFPSKFEQSDQLFINPDQWYSTTSGQNDLKLVLQLFSIFGNGDVQMSRNQVTHNVQIKFSHHDTKWVVECLPGFPQQGATLKKESYDILKKTYNEISVNTVSKTEIEEIVKELKNEVKRHCKKCSGFHKTTLGWSR